MTTLHDSRHCGAKKRQGEGTCARPAGWGTDHVGFGPCKLHGGCSPSVARIVAEQQALQLFGKLVPDITPITNPLDAYAQFAGEVMAWKQLMHSLLEDLSSVEVTTQAQGEQTRAKVQLYERAMDRANTVLSTYARLNIDARLATITKQQADMVMRAVEAAINHFAPAPEQADAAKAIAIRHLRAAKDAA